MLSDCHVIKMNLENAQILSSVCYNLGMKLDGIPKPYNPKHPVIQAINNQSKINWLLEYNIALHNEFYYRFNKRHSYYSLIEKYAILGDGWGYFYNELDFARDFKDFVSEYKDLVKSFRSYYRYKKSIIKRCKYSNGTEPDWLL
jgi:hypothetical protein